MIKNAGFGDARGRKVRFRWVFGPFSNFLPSTASSPALFCMCYSFLKSICNGLSRHIQVCSCGESRSWDTEGSRVTGQRGLEFQGQMFCPLSRDPDLWFAWAMHIWTAFLTGFSEIYTTMPVGTLDQEIWRGRELQPEGSRVTFSPLPPHTQLCFACAIAFWIAFLMGFHKIYTTVPVAWVVREIQRGSRVTQARGVSSFQFLPSISS